MNYLLDTHVFLWTILASKKITKDIRKILLHSENNKYVSIVTFWEISLKFSLGKIDLKNVLPDELPNIARKSGFKILHVDPDIASSFYKLSKTKNKDPFDRMLAWQAICNNMCLITKDPDFTTYKNHGLKTVW